MGQRVAAQSDVRPACPSPANANALEFAVVTLGETFGGAGSGFASRNPRLGKNEPRLQASV